MSEQEQGTLPLSVLVDRLAGAQRRNEEFARDFASWFSRQAPHLTLAPLEQLGLVDVVLTFRLRGKVTLVATGRLPGGPGEVTVRFEEHEFPFIEVRVERSPRREAYEVCTMDHSVEGRSLTLVQPVRRGNETWPAGTRATALVDTTIGEDRHLNVRLESGRTINVAREDVRLDPP